MPTIAEAAAANAQRISQGGKTGAALVAPTAPNPLLPDPPATVTNAPSRGVFPASLVLASDLTDSSLVFQRNIVRSRSFPYPPAPTAPSTKQTIIQQVATPAPSVPSSGSTTDTDFYQTVQQAGAVEPQEPNLNFLAPITATDNTSNASTDIAVPNVVGDSGSGGTKGLVPAPPAGSAAAGKYLKADGSFQVPPGTGGAANYQTVEQAGVSKPSEPDLNFLAPITATDNAGNTSTDIAVPVFVASGASHATGLVPDPGASAGSTHFLREDATWATVSGGDLTAKYIVGDSPVPADLTNAKSWPGLYNSPDIPPISPTAMDDEFDGVSLSGIWSFVNQGSATATVSQSWLNLSCVSNGSASSLRMITQALPAAPYEFKAKRTSQYAAGGSFEYFGGLLLRESSTGKIITLSVDHNNSANFVLRAVYWSSSTVDASSLAAVATPLGGPVYVLLGRSGTTLYFKFSCDGVNFVQFYSETLTTHFTTAPDQVGLGISPYATTVSMGCDFFRRTV